MNKNKKRLSKLLVPMLALSGVAMNNTEAARRSVSVGTKRARYNLGNDYKVESEKSEIKILIKNHNIPNGGGSFVIAHGGSAWDQFSEKYELLEQDRYKKFRAKLNIDGIPFYGDGAGAEGTLTKCRDKKTGKIFAVKCELKKENKNELIDSDNSYQFYKDSQNPKYGWSRKKWAVKMHDHFSDDKVTYTITDWIEGPTLQKYMESLQKERNLIKKVKKFGKIMKQLKQILTDLHDKGCVNSDISGKNVMVEINPENEFDIQLKVVDNGAYTHEKKVWTYGYPLNCFRQIFSEALDSPHGQIFNYFDLKQSYTNLRNKGKLNIEMWYPPYNESQNQDNINALLFLELSLVNDALGNPQATDMNGKLVFTPRVGDIQPDCLDFAVKILTEELPKRLQDLKTNNYSPYLKHY